MKIRFTEDYAPKDGIGRTYTAGQEIEVREDSARHFISRRKAVAVDHIADPSKMVEAEPPVPKAPDSSLPDSVEYSRSIRKTRKVPSSVSGTSDFETGDDA